MSRLQRGSGTVDSIVGLSVEHPLHGGRWIGSLAARTPVAENSDGLRVGASWELGTGWAHTVKTHRVMAFGRMDWLHRQQDVFNGTPVLVGGGNWLYLTPGVAVMPVLHKTCQVPDALLRKQWQVGFVDAHVLSVRDRDHRTIHGIDGVP